MVAIISPQPRRPSAPSAVCAWQATPPCLEDPFAYNPTVKPISAEPLLPAFHLPPQCGRQSSRHPCTPTKSPRRRRSGVPKSCPKCARRHRSAVCLKHIGHGAEGFDELPWIKLLSIAPNPAQALDLADIDLIEAGLAGAAPSSGPVRRRKSSLRTDPLVGALATANETDPTLSLFPFVHPFAPPQTPLPQEPFHPEEARFRDLLPILPGDVEQFWMPPMQSD